MQKSTRVLIGVLFLLFVVTACIWASIFQSATQGKLTVTFLNIGQGDAIFIESPTGAQMLIDGGKNRAVLRELSRTMPLFDRSIDVVMGTHPDADHIGGLPDVLRRYRVGLVVGSSVLDKKGADSAAFEEAITREVDAGAAKIVASRGQLIELGGGVQVEILFPDRSLSSVDTNTGCTITRLVYGETAFLFPCDSPKAIEEYLVKLDAGLLKSNVLKVGHHGSRTSSALSFVGFVSPEYAVFSRGCDNSYGHPHEEPIATFARFGIPTLDTCLDGRITFVSDGRVVERK